MATCVAGQHPVVRPRIAFVTYRDPMDRRSRSGCYYFMVKALQKYCGDVHCVGPVCPVIFRAGQVFNKASRFLLGKGYDYTHSVPVAKNLAKFFKQRLSCISPDLIFAPVASTEIAYLDTSIPIVYESDATFASVEGYYAIYSGLFDFSSRQAHLIEKLAIQKASLLIYLSQRAARSAIRDYQAEGSKIHIIPQGANFEDIPSAETVLHPRGMDECRLLFVGVDWVRKGGEIAVEALNELRTMGIPARLTICGCVPPSRFRVPEIQVIPYLDKNAPAERNQLAELYLASHFLLLPTRSESYGIVFCESNAFGLPAITTNTGGVPDVISDGENGFMLPPSAGGREYAKLIAEIWQDRGRYSALARSSRRTFDERLNWDAWGLAVSKLIPRVL